MSQEGPVRVVLADDHRIVRSGLRLELGVEPAIEVVGEATSFHELMKLLAEVPADVVVLDLLGMGMPPITAVSVLARTYPKTAPIVFSSSLTGVHELERVGGRGYIAKEDREENLAEAIFAVRRGEIYRSPAVVDYLEKSGRAQKDFKLAPKEWEVLRLIAHGMGTQEIMAELSIVEQTVINYISRLYQKTGCKERTQLVEWYSQFGREQEDEKKKP